MNQLLASSADSKFEFNESKDNKDNKENINKNISKAWDGDYLVIDKLIKLTKHNIYLLNI